VDKEGRLLAEGPEKSLNKIGHALHKFYPVFNSVTFSDKVKDVVKSMTNMAEPTIIQSMVIFKHPKVGGEGEDSD